MSSASSMLTQIPLGSFEVTPWNPDSAVAGGMTCALHFLLSYEMMGDRSFDCPTEFPWPLDEMGHAEQTGLVLTYSKQSSDVSHYRYVQKE